jgi:predicted PurR-regulated permease PerM
MTQKVDLSTSTLVRFVLIVLGIWFLYLIRDVIVLLFMVLIIVSGLSPTVDRWSKYLTRPGAVISVFMIFLLVMSLIFSLLVPPLIDQLQQFTSNLPAYAEQLSRSDNQGFLKRRVLSS